MKFKFFVFSFLFAILLSGCEKNSSPQHNEPIVDTNDSSTYITQVFDYVYAPGQYATNSNLTNAQNFIGKPSYLQTTNATIQKTSISLGGWGGYIVAGFNHNISNFDGNDFIVFCGNSPASEPAIVYVMQDENGNNLPDDNWYELKGSEHNNTATYHNYQVVYYKPVSVTSNIFWKDNKGNSDSLKAGYGVSCTSSWWKYNAEDSLIFNGTRLPDAYQNISSTPTENWAPIAGLFSWGYAENANANNFNLQFKGNEFDISNAIDTNGNAVSLTTIRFIKIQTGVFQQAGWLNEISTEIYGAADLNLLNSAN